MERIFFDQLAQFDEIEHCVVKSGYPMWEGYEQIASANQVHSDQIAIVQKGGIVDGVDGLITVQKGVTLTMRHADCQATLFYDPVMQVIANVHCGWRGQVKNIYKNCVEKLCTECRCNVKNLVVCIGPSLGPHHAEFVNYRQEFPQEWWRYCEQENRFNLWQIALDQLRALGIKEGNIEIAKICTYREGWHSYRRDKTKERHTTMIKMRYAL